MLGNLFIFFTNGLMNAQSLKTFFQCICEKKGHNFL